MIYDLSSEVQVSNARKRLEFLVSKKSRIELTAKTHKRTLSQNSYLHLCLAYYGTQVGLTKAEAKTDFKNLNDDYLVYEKKGHRYFRSTADLNKEEMMICLDRFIAAVESEGYVIPKPDDLAHIDYALNAVEQARHFQ